ncbi:hypothetical protein HK096_011308, partial [Nowakowskiella sp. JEL0078]
METDSVKLGVGTSFYHPDCFPSAYLNFDAEDDGENVHGFSDLSTTQKEATKEAIKKVSLFYYLIRMAKEARATADPAEIKQKRKALTKKTKEAKEDDSSEGKKSGRVRQAPKRLVDEGRDSDEDDEDEDGKKKRKKKTVKKSEDDEEDFSPNGKPKKGRGRKATKKTEVSEEEDEDEQDE